VLRLRGGAKKRKKKSEQRAPAPLASHAPPAYTKPKKNKHKRKKNKLAFLTFYKVDDSGKVTRLRKECPSPECGAGVFMANHFDRHYCGKCGLTYVYEAVRPRCAGQEWCAPETDSWPCASSVQDQQQARPKQQKAVKVEAAPEAPAKGKKVCARRNAAFPTPD